MSLGLDLDAPRLLRREPAVPFTAADAFAWDQPIVIDAGPVRSSTGQVLPVAALRRVGCAVVRQVGAGELWDPATKAWRAADFGASVAPQTELVPLVMNDPTDMSAGWSGVAMLLDEARFARDADRFALRTYVEAQLDGATVHAWSASSIALRVARDAGQRMLFEMEPGLLPRFARMFAGVPLRTEVRVEESQLLLRAFDPSGAVRASVRLSVAGELEIRSLPADASRQASIVFDGLGSIQIEGLALSFNGAAIA